MPLILRPAEEADSPRIGRIGANAFQQTLSRFLFPAHLHSRSETGDPVRDEAEWRAARNLRRMRDGNPTFVVVDIAEGGAETEEVVGFAQWELPSQVVAPAPEATVEADKDPMPGALDQEELRKLYRVIETETKKALGPDGHRNMWYLMILAIDPAHQRRGIGRTLVQHGLDQAAKAGTDAFLIATPEGRGLYHSCGFREVGEPIMWGSTPHYSMLWKNPRSGLS